MIEIGLFPIPEWVRSVALFGGSFDPPHVGHGALPEAAREAAAIDWLLYVPAARSPHKDKGPEATDEDRLAMLKAALEGRERCSISTIELERGPPSLTIDTLRSLIAMSPRSLTWRLIIGADQAAAFHRWREPREIMALADPLVLLRAPAETPERLETTLGAWNEEERRHWMSCVVSAPVMDVSATEVRRILKTVGPDEAERAGLILPAVACEIRARGLYLG